MTELKLMICPACKNYFGVSYVKDDTMCPYCYWEQTEDYPFRELPEKLITMSKENADKWNRVMELSYPIGVLKNES